MIPPDLNEKIREMNLYRIREILGAGNPRVFEWVVLTLLSAFLKNLEDKWHKVKAASVFAKILHRGDVRWKQAGCCCC